LAKFEQIGQFSIFKNEYKRMRSPFIFVKVKFYLQAAFLIDLRGFSVFLVI